MTLWGKVFYDKALSKKVGAPRWGVRGKWQGKRHSIYKYMGEFPCESEAAASQLQHIITDEVTREIFNPARHLKKKPLHLAQWSKTWLTQIRPDIESATLKDYRNSINNHILPVLGKKFLPDIGYEDLKKLMNKIDRAPKGKKNVMGCLHKLMVDAKLSGHINQLPPWPKFTGKNTVIPPAIKYISAKDQWLILEKIPLKHRPMFMFMMATGCRPSEARAFRWVDISESHIVFEKTFNDKEQLRPVKGKKIKPFPMTDEIQEILDGVKKNLTKFVFLNPTTKAPYSKNINKIWNRACKAAGIETIQLYKATRHSFACQLLNAGMDKGMVSRLLRHSDPRMIERYGEYELETIGQAVDNVRRLSVGHEYAEGQ
jgi:integrase